PFSSFFFTIRHPPSSTLFPYTTLFRSIFRCTYYHAIRRFYFACECRNILRSSCLIYIWIKVWKRCNCIVDFNIALGGKVARQVRSEEHTSELQSRENLVCRLLLEKKKK